MRALLMLGLCTALVGCATASTPSVSSSSTQAAKTRTARTRAARRPAARRRRHPARTAVRAPVQLAVGTADNHTVQPQPPAGSCHARGTGELSLPDRVCTAGAIDPAVTQADIGSTICVVGYTSTVRPPESVTGREKLASMAAYGDAGSAHAYEYDHLVSLELGGATNDARNLWPEPGQSPNVKDRLENRLHAMVCAGAITLAAAQQEIATDWVAAYRRYVGPTP